MDVLGDIGGVYESLISIFGLFLFRISKHSFRINTIKKLFYVQTKDKGLFKQFNPKPTKDHLCGL